MTTDDELGAELRRDLQSTFVPFDEARAAEMIDVATEAELVSARRYWAAPAAAAAAVIAVGGTAAVLAAGHDGGGGTPAGGDPATTSSPTTSSAPVFSWSCTYPIKVKGKLGVHLRLVPVRVPSFPVLPNSTTAPTGGTGRQRLPTLSLASGVPAGTGIVVVSGSAGHTITCRLTKVTSSAVPTSVDTVPAAPTSVPSGATGTPAAPPTGQPASGQTETTTVPALPHPSSSAPAVPTAPLSLPGTPTS